MGAYMRTNGAVGARNVAQFMAGPYRIPHVKIDSALWMTNKTPVGTYRGPGRFEANFFSSGCSTWLRTISASTASRCAAAT